METALKREIISSKGLSRAIGVSLFVILTALGGFVRIPLPFTPVPLTLQTFFVLLSGLILGRGLGLLSQFSYLILGIAGLSVFSGPGCGLLYLLGPTGGYLYGFLIASTLTGQVRGAKASFKRTFFLLCSADLLLLACGTIWLKFTLNLSIAQSLSLGFLPFLAGDMIKALSATLIYLKIENRVKMIF
ncbi:MAG TPA: biotin transporter BioY [Candidatus Margulisiibacteriota bacterium]|nr:biotin transporter BioY [Candidatus Margulisiibacteriota bacterium]